MIQRLAEVEPVVIDASFECAYGFSVQAEKPSGFAPLLDSGTAETFQTAMSDDFIATPNFRRMVLTRDSSKKIDRTDEDVPKSIVRTVEDMPKSIEITAKVLPDIPNRATVDIPKNNVHIVEEVSREPIRIADDLLQKALNTLKDSSLTAVRVVSNEPKINRVFFQPVEVKPPCLGVHVVGDMSKSVVKNKPTNHAYFNGQEMEQVQIIAPAPLPIELPISAVPQQSPISIATSEIAQVFVAAAEAVADAILVSSGFSDGEGSIIVRLQPEVLSGSEVRLVAKDGVLTVVVDAVTDDVQKIVETNRVQFEQHIAEKVHSWRISVAVRRGGKSDERI